MRTRTHTCIRKHAHTQTRAHTNARTHTHAHSHECTHTQTHTEAHAHSHTHILTPILAHTHWESFVRTQYGWLKGFICKPYSVDAVTEYISNPLGPWTPARKYFSFFHLVILNLAFKRLQRTLLVYRAGNFSPRHTKTLEGAFKRSTWLAASVCGYTLDKQDTTMAVLNAVRSASTSTT